MCQCEVVMKEEETETEPPTVINETSKLRSVCESISPVFPSV